MNKYNIGIISSILIFLVLTGLVLAYPIQLNLQSNLGAGETFTTFVANCADAVCSSFVNGTERSIPSPGNLNSYVISGSGTVTWLELDYKDESLLPHLYRLQATDSSLNGPHTVSRNFQKKSVCEAEINKLELSANSVQENNRVTVSANVQSSMAFPKDAQGNRFDFSMVPIPANLRDIFSTKTNVSLTVKDSNNQTVKQETQQVNPWIGKSENLSFEFTPTLQGNHTVELLTAVTDSVCQSANSKTKQVNLTVTDAGPTANAGPDRTVRVGEVVQFDGSATITSDDTLFYLWDFGNGNKDEGLRVNYTYQSTGNYTVTLRVKDVDRQESTDTAVVSVEPAVNRPVANFEAVPSTVEEGQDVQFTDKSTYGDGLKTRSWNFGDGTPTVSDQSPRHAFQNQGTYTVNLKIVDSTDDVSEKQLNVTVTDTKPSADFDVPSITEGQEVQFTDKSTARDGIKTRSWNFGDGTTSADTSPRHTFAQNGTFTVTLSVSDNDDADSTPKPKQVSVADTIPAVAFDVVANAIKGQAVQFTDRSTAYDGIKSRAWNFGDGTPASNEANPAHTFANTGTFNVTLTVVDNDNSPKDLTKQVVVTETPVTRDVAVSSISYSKSSSTVYLFGQVTVKANVSNLGSATESVSVKLKEGLADLTSQTVSLNAGETKEVSFAWTPSTKGFRTLTIEATPLQSEANTANNLQTQNIKVFSIQENIELVFADPSRFPSSIQSKNSDFYIWVNIRNKGLEDLKDLKFVLDIPLPVVDSRDHVLSTEKVFSLIPSGKPETYLWIVAAGSVPTSLTAKVYVGSGSDKVEVSRPVSIQ